MRNEKYRVLVSKINSIKELAHESANDIYSRFNILVNEINELGLTPIGDEQVVRMIFQVLLSKYKLVISNIYNNNIISKIPPSQVLSKITAHEMHFFFSTTQVAELKQTALPDFG